MENRERTFIHTHTHTETEDSDYGQNLEFRIEEIAEKNVLSLLRKMTREND